MTKLKLLVGKAAIVKAIASIANRGKKLEQDMHLVACSILDHVDQHGDVTVLNAMIDDMPKSARTNALREWFLEFGKVAYNEESKHFVYNKAGTTKLQSAMEQPFWEFKPEKAFVAFDLNAEITKLLKRVEKAAKDERNEIDVAQLAALKELAVKQGEVTVQ